MRDALATDGPRRIGRTSSFGPTGSTAQPLSVAADPGEGLRIGRLDPTEERTYPGAHDSGAIGPWFGLPHAHWP